MTMMNIVNQEENTPEIRCCDYRRARHLVRAFCLGNLASLQLLLWQVLDIHEFSTKLKKTYKKRAYPHPTLRTLAYTGAISKLAP